MNSPPVQPKPCRFVALDVHKRYAVAAAIDAEQRVVLKPHRIALDDIVAWARRHLQPTDAVVLEATANAWTLHDQLRPFVASVTVAHPLLVKLIACTRVKTDARDTLSLARLLSAGLIPAVWVPPLEVRELRALIGQRRRLVRQRTQAYNRLHSVLHRHNLVPPGGGVFGPACRPWWEGLALPTTERLRVRQDLALLDCIGPLIGEVEQEIARLSTAEPWAGQVAFLVQLPGIGVLTAMALLGAIGDITRFPSARKLVGYAGLGASIYDTGQTHRTGAITKQGRREIRAALVEAAWVAVQTHPRWKAQFERLERRKGSGKAIVAIARKLLVVVWHVLSAQVADRHADAAKVAAKFVSWAESVGKAQRQGETRGRFVRRELTRLGIGQTLARIGQGDRVVCLPPLEAIGASP
jgi:transposase